MKRSFFYILIAALLGQMASPAVLASYTYDALGRRITATIGNTTTRYYYAGQRVIEERDAADNLVRYHVGGGQYIDERVATYSQATAAFEYYLLGDTFSVVGSGDAAGSSIQRLEYTAGGTFTGSASSLPADLDGDGDVDLADYTLLAGYANGPGQAGSGTGWEAADFDADGDVDLKDFLTFQSQFGQTGSGGPASGAFALHGRPVDVLGDGHVLMYVRARYYDPANGRWLQRDPAGYVDGGNLYEAFGNNPVRNIDPQGTYFKLASSWKQGHEVYWQSIIPIAAWLFTDEPKDELYLGRYYWSDGQKFVVYDGPVWDEPSSGVQRYVIPFDALEAWAKQEIDQASYERFLLMNGVPLNDGGKVVRRRTLDVVGLGLSEAYAEHVRSVEQHIVGILPNTIAQTAEMIVTGGVDPVTQRNMTGREVRAHGLKVGWEAVGTVGVTGVANRVAGALPAGVGRAPVPVRALNRGPTTWGNQKTLADHFNRHGKDFGARSTQHYADQASDFLRSSQTQRLPTKIDADGVIRVYDPKTNTFGSFNPDGSTKTFFKPTRGVDYWNSQPGVAPWEAPR